MAAAGPNPAMRREVERTLPTASASWTKIGQSPWTETWRAVAGSTSYFVKTAPPAGHAMLAAEAAGLAALAATRTVRVPQGAACGQVPTGAFLALEWLELAGRGGGAALGRALAALHRHTAARFGWERDNTVGASPQVNTWDEDWARFFAERRIGVQLALAADRRRPPWADEGERLLSAIPRLLQSHSPVPSLLHGDLWAGNAGTDATGEPVVFDPAVYHGDREADLAMTELFGGFGADFHAAYLTAWPLPAGYPRRRLLYNLYHVLNHFNLFGGAYGAQALQMMHALLASH